MDIGGSVAFVDSGILTFVSKRDYHEDMTGYVFEEWFEQMLDLISKGSITITDDASYCPRLKEPLSTSSWHKSELYGWLN